MTMKNKFAIWTFLAAATTATVSLPAMASSFDSTIIVMPPILTAPPSSEDNVGGHIVGGEDAAKGEFPYYATPTGENGICGGALIATNIILTAAHCKPVFNASGTIWKVGNTDDITVFDPIYEEKIEQQSFIVHPDYEASSTAPFFLKYDYAIIVLKNSYTNSNVGFIAPAGKDYIVEEEQPFTIMGRGKTSGNSAASDTMQKVALKHFDVDDCAQLYQRGKGEVDPEVNLCAGDIEEGRGTCGGDSGGPLVDVNDNIVGVVSWGRADCHPGAPGVFARVSKGWDWINDQVCANALDIPDWAVCARGSGE